MNKKIIGVIFAVVLLSFGVLAASEMGYVSLPFSLTGDYFVKPQWSRLECVPTDTYEGKTTLQIDGGAFNELKYFECGLNMNTDSCKIYAESPGFLSSSIALIYKICDRVSGGYTNCGGEATIILQPNIRTFITQIDNSQSIAFVPVGGWFGYGVTVNIEAEYRPWKLYRFDGGATYEQKASDCCLTQQLWGRIPDQDTNLECLTMTGGIGSKWVNYVEDWVYGPATHIYQYNNDEVYCRAGVLYDIVELKMKYGTLVKIDPDYNPPSDAPSYLSGLGNMVASVECCPYESGCNDNFEYDGTGGGDECFSDTQCYNGGYPVPYTSSSYKVQTCEEGTCEWSAEINTECTSNAACPPGEICDLSLTNYGQCIQQSDSPYCGDGFCDRTETPSSCPADCGEGSGFTFGDWTQWLIFIIMGAVGALLGYLLNKKDRVLWAGLGGIIGIVLAFVIKWVFDNWLLITLTGILGVTGAMVALYFVGPTLIIIIMLLQGGGGNK